LPGDRRRRGKVTSLVERHEGLVGTRPFSSPSQAATETVLARVSAKQTEELQSELQVSEDGS
jgi:hypothetical protein